MITKIRAAAYTDCDGRLWIRREDGRYCHLLTAATGSQSWVSSSYGNLRREFGPLTAAQAPA